MNNSVEEVVQEQVAPEVQAEQAKPQEIESLAKHELSVEEQARLQGWRPKEEFEGDPNQWKDAKHFLEVGESWKKQAALARELKELREQYKSLVEGQTQLQKMEYERAYHDIIAAKTRVASNPNPNLQEYERIIQRENELKQQMAQTQHQIEDPRVAVIKNSAAWAKFSLLNPWIDKTDPDSMYLRTKAQEYSAQMPLPQNEAEIDKNLTLLHNKMKADYGHLINRTLPQRPKTMPVTYSSGNGSSGDKYDDLSIGHKKAIEYLQSRPGDPAAIKKSVEAYLKSIKK